MWRKRNSFLEGLNPLIVATQYHERAAQYVIDLRPRRAQRGYLSTQGENLSGVLCVEVGGIQKHVHLEEVNPCIAPDRPR